MARPRLSDEVKKARGTFRPSRADNSVASLCDSANRRLQAAKTLLDPESYAVYEAAIHRIEFDTPHLDGKHAVPSIDCLDDIELIEGAVDALLDSIGADEYIRSLLALRSSFLYRMIIEAREA